jgi:hypothetical protein
MKTKQLILFLILIQLFLQNESKRILLVSCPAYSHTYPITGIAKELSKEHEVHIIMSKKYNNWLNKIKNIQIHELEMNLESFTKDPSQGKHGIEQHLAEHLLPLLIGIYNNSIGKITEIADEVKPDLIISDFFMVPIMDYAHKNQIKLIISVNGGGMTDKTFLPTMTSLKPIKEINIYDRIYKSVISPIKMIWYTLPILQELNKIRLKHGYSEPNIIFDYFENNVNFLQSFNGFEYVINTKPNNIYLGGYFGI